MPVNKPDESDAATTTRQEVYDAINRLHTRVILNPREDKELEVILDECLFRLEQLEDVEGC